ERLAAQVMQGGVEGADRQAITEVRSPDLSPQSAVFPRVLADERGAEFVDQSPHTAEGGGLAPAGQPLVGADFHEQRFARGVPRRRWADGAGQLGPQEVGLDGSNFHGCSRLWSTRSAS